jgi:hypothetical protein
MRQGCRLPALGDARIHSGRMAVMKAHASAAHATKSPLNRIIQRSESPLSVDERKLCASFDFRDGAACGGTCDAGSRARTTTPVGTL